MRSTRLALIALGLVAAAGVLRASSGVQEQSQPGDRLDRAALWLKAILRHEPGETDDAARLVASWPTRAVRTLWIDASAIVQLARDPRRSGITVRMEGRGPSAIRYTPNELHRLRVLGCAAGGIVLNQVCLDLRAPTELDPELLQLSEAVDAAKTAGDDNFVLRRGALLHTDIAMFLPHATEGLVSAAAAGGPQRIRIQTTDGMQMDLGQVPPHWELARELLDRVRPAGAAMATPALDPMVRLWYRATAAWMQAREQHDTVHLDRAREIFPNDADILFLSACQHEVYAGAPIQTVVREAYVPTGVKADVASERSELHQAETLFRKALAANASIAEAHLRLGRVLSLLDRNADAIVELRAALAATRDDVLGYFASLFLGAALEATRDFDAARDAYIDASRRFPAAQSPHIALSALARRRGDRGGALRDMQQLFARPDRNPETDDPWWEYYVVQARNADALLDDLRRPFRRRDR
jgi:tetratricopeptide (TPR) repeat protein